MVPRKEMRFSDMLRNTIEVPPDVFLTVDAAKQDATLVLYLVGLQRSVLSEQSTSIILCRVSRGTVMSASR